MFSHSPIYHHQVWTKALQMPKPHVAFAYRCTPAKHRGPDGYSTISRYLRPLSFRAMGAGQLLSLQAEKAAWGRWVWEKASGPARATSMGSQYLCSGFPLGRWSGLGSNSRSELELGCSLTWNVLDSLCPGF